jgi:hypothetical protein
VDKLIVYVDDAAHAMAVLKPLLAQDGCEARQWIVVACAPRVTHHVSKWVTHSARESWRGKWTDKLFAQLLPWLQTQGQHVQTCIGKNNLVAQTEHLMREHGPARVVDARRPKQSLGAQQVLVPRPGLLGMAVGLLGPGLLVLD